jgi:hypothetical protein
MGYRNRLLQTNQQRRNAPVVFEEDASYQPLQPTCCHENPRERSPLELGAFTLPTAVFRPEPPPELAP